MSTSPTPLAALQACVRLAALFHDLGKATQLFQSKLRASEPVSDAVRHEVMSLYVYDEAVMLAGDGATDRAVLQRLERLTAHKVDQLFERAATRALDLHTRCRNRPEARAAFLAPTLDGDGPDRKLVRAIALLIISHHRLYEGSNTWRPLAHKHVNTEALVTLADFACAEGDRPWHEFAWLADVHGAARDLVDVPDGLTGVELPGVYALGRTALMLGDHIGSSEKQAALSWSGILANTVRADDERMPADDLGLHLARVTHAAGETFAALTELKDAYPSIAQDVLPPAIGDPQSPTGSRFAWQGAAANLAFQSMRAQPEAGFFACLMAATGTGKTRGAPAVLAAACRADPDPARQGLRYNLALGLRTLARQSGLEYVRDLGFKPDQVAILAGGLQLPPDDVLPEASGSEDRDLLPGVDVSHLDGGPANGLPDRIGPTALPDIIQRAVAASRAPLAFARLVATPVLSATIDHFMPAADGRRGSHLPAMIRVATSDLVIDEVDLFDPEDLAAIGRLVFLSASFGRRVIIMSASVNDEIATALFGAYRAGWSSYSAAFDRPDGVVALIASDAPDIMSAALTPDAQSFRLAFRQICSTMCQRIAEQTPLRRLQPAAEAAFRTDWCAAISDTASTLHDTLAADLDGIKVSVGLIRLSNISRCMGLFRALTEAQPHPSVLVRLMCLHSRFPFAGRFAREALLKEMLTRKGGPGQDSVGLQTVLNRLEILQDARDGGYASVQILVVSSPVVETGNDLDFDYAIIEPSSTRAVLQTAGRVFRHRAGRPEHPNIVVLPSTIAGLTGADRGRAYRWPGVESPQAMGIRRIVLRSVNFADLIDVARLRDGIDARIILSDEASRDALVADERRLERSYLDDQAPQGPHQFGGCERRRFDAIFPERRRFRRDDETTSRLFMTTDATWDRRVHWSLRRGNTTIATAITAATALDYADHVAPLTCFDPIAVARSLAPEIAGPLALRNDLLLGCDVRDRLIENGCVYDDQTGFSPRQTAG